MVRRSGAPARPAPGTVAGDLKQTKPFRTRGQEAMVGLRLTADAVRRYGEGVLSPFGITLQQYNVLRILRGSQPDSLPTLEIASRMVEKAPGVTRLLDRLERKGLVSRKRRVADRRQVLCAITPKGLALLEEMEPAVREYSKRLNTMPQRDLEHLITLLNALRLALR